MGTVCYKRPGTEIYCKDCIHRNVCQFVENTKVNNCNECLMAPDYCEKNNCN